jgi:hypothetical protein
MDFLRRHSTAFGVVLIMAGSLFALSLAKAGEQDLNSDDSLRIEITRKGLGKQVVISQGVKEWFMLIDVTPENAVVIRQEKDQERYLVDESETHDRPMTPGEVDAAIADYVNSVKTRTRKQ